MHVRTYTARVTDRDGSNERWIEGEVRVFDGAPGYAVKNLAKGQIALAGLVLLDLHVAPKT